MFLLIALIGCRSCNGTPIGGGDDISPGDREQCIKAFAVETGPWRITAIYPGWATGSVYRIGAYDDHRSDDSWAERIDMPGNQPHFLGGATAWVVDKALDYPACGGTVCQEFTVVGYSDANGVALQHPDHYLDYVPKCSEIPNSCVVSQYHEPGDYSITILRSNGASGQAYLRIASDGDGYFIDRFYVMSNCDEFWPDSSVDGVRTWIVTPIAGIPSSALQWPQFDDRVMIQKFGTH